MSGKIQTVPFFYAIIPRGKNCIMSIKVAIIGSDQIIGDVKEVLDEDKSRQYLICNPLKLILQPQRVMLTEEEEDDTNVQQTSSQVSFATWQPLTADTQFLVNPNNVQTVYEPLPDIKTMYLELLNGN